MAAKPVLSGEEWGGQLNWHTKHEHCKECGTCFIAGITKKVHKCPAPIETAIVEVFKSDRDRYVDRASEVPHGFQEV